MHENVFVKDEKFENIRFLYASLFEHFIDTIKKYIRMKSLRRYATLRETVF